jgi:hypothetical protein
MLRDQINIPETIGQAEGHSKNTRKSRLYDSFTEAEKLKVRRGARCSRQFCRVSEGSGTDLF